MKKLLSVVCGWLVFCASLWAQSPLLIDPILPGVWADEIRAAPFTQIPLTMIAEDMSISTMFGTVWMGPTNLRPTPNTALLMSIVSTSANDNISGTGAQTVVIRCLDDSFESFAEFIDMNGTMPVVMAAPCFRVQSASTMITGSTHRNEGDITLTNAATVYEFITAGETFSKSGAKTIPHGVVGSLFEIGISINTKPDKTTTIEFIQILENGTEFPAKFHISGNVGTTFTVGCFDQHQNIEIRAKAESGAGASEIEIRFTLLLIDSATGQCP